MALYLTGYLPEDQTQGIMIQIFQPFAAPLTIANKAQRRIASPGIVTTHVCHIS